MPDLGETLELHFDPSWGAPYWLDVRSRLGWDPRRELRSFAEVHRLGPMDAGALRARPVEDLIPRGLRARRSEMVLAETGGTTGAPARRVFLPEEFEAAFVRPWARAADARAFPRDANWLFVGPGGPHVIGQAARAMARVSGSLEPFTVDCDPRWARRQEAGSLGHRLYVDHVVEQACNVLATQEVAVLFTTPPLLAALADRLPVERRARIRGVHLGGMRIDAALCRVARERWFPNACVLPGYGNSLMGVMFECGLPGPDHEPRYVADDPALHVQVAPPDAEGRDGVDLARWCRPGERGRVVVHRLDRSFLLLNLVERDRATVSAGGAGVEDVEPWCPNGSIPVGEVY